MGKSEARKPDQHHTSWQPDTDVVHQLLLDNILKGNPVPTRTALIT